MLNLTEDLKERALDVLYDIAHEDCCLTVLVAQLDEHDPRYWDLYDRYERIAYAAERMNKTAQTLLGVAFSNLANSPEGLEAIAQAEKDARREIMDVLGKTESTLTSR